MPRREKKQVLEKQSREFVVLLRDYFEREQQNGGPLLPLTRVVERVSHALQIGTNTVCRITREKYGKSGMEDNELKTPNIPRTRRRRKTSKSTTGVNTMPKECNPRVNGVCTNKSENEINTTLLNISMNLKTVPIITSSRENLQNTCVTTTAPKTGLIHNLPKISNPMVSGFESTTEKSISGVKTKCAFSETSTKIKCRTITSKSLLDPIHDMPNIFSSTLSDFGSTTDSIKTDVKSGNKNNYPIHTTSTKPNPAKDHSIKLQFKEDLEDNIILVVHPTIDDHLPINSWQNNKTLY